MTKKGDINQDKKNVKTETEKVNKSLKNISTDYIT